MPTARQNLVNVDVQPTQNTPENIISERTMNVLAVIHLSCWTISIVLGIAAVWIRAQNTPGIEESFFGIVGAGVWVSTPYFSCGILCIASGKTQNTKVISWLMLVSICSCIFALALLSYSSLAVAKESEIEVIPRRLVVAAVTASVSLLETITSIATTVICFNAIGLFCNFKKNFKTKIKLKSGKVGHHDDNEPGHVTVMALPAQQAMELFVSMYRPYINPSYLNAGFDSSQEAMMHQFYSEGSRRNQFYSEDYHRPKKHRHRRSKSRNDSPDNDSLSRFPNDELGVDLHEMFDEDGNIVRPQSKQSHVRVSTADNEKTPRNRLPTVPETSVLPGPKCEENVEYSEN